MKYKKLLSGVVLGGLTFFSGCVPNTPQVIEINSVPPPFDVNGRFPYVVWANGERVDLPREELILLVKKIGKDNIKPSKNKDIHAGWLFPHSSPAPQL